VLLYVLGGNVCSCMFEVAMCVVESSKWRSDSLGLLSDIVSCWVF